MTRLHWLVQVLRDAHLDVVEYPGWQTRGLPLMRPRVVVIHHTATHWTTPDATVTHLLVKGRADLPGPLCHLGLDRDGRFIVIAAGKANHAGTGRWMDADTSVETIGIEAYNWGSSTPLQSREPWPVVQLQAYERGVAALLRRLNRDERYVCAHREWALPAGRKPDPAGIDMPPFRYRVGKLLEEDEMTLRPGDTGNAVRAIQRSLNVWAPDLGIAEDGIYGPNTEMAVRVYQTAAHLSVSGIVDGVTAALLLTVPLRT